MRKTFKKIIATILTATMAMSISVPAFASEQEVFTNDVGVVSHLEYDAVQALKEKYNLIPCNEETQEKILDEISTLALSNVKKDIDVSKCSSIVGESYLDNLSVAKLSATDINSLFANNKAEVLSTPAAPDASNGVAFYAINSKYTISGTIYDVIQIVAYSQNLKSPLAEQENFNLINAAPYTVSQLNKVISTVCGLASNLKNLSVLTLGSYIEDISSFCSTSSSQEIAVSASMSQIMCYAYVNTGTLPYDLMLTTQRVDIADNYSLKSIENGMVQLSESFGVTGHAESDYYSKLSRAANQYATNPAAREEYYVGTSVKYYYDGILKKQISVDTYPSPESIPPGFNV